MKNFGKLLILLSVLFSVLLGFQIVAYFGVKLGFAIISLIFMGGVALSLVMAGNNNSQEDLFIEDFLEDLGEN